MPARAWCHQLLLLLLPLSLSVVSRRPGSSKMRLPFLAGPLDALTVCKTSPLLTRDQSDLCTRYPDASVVALQGIGLAIHECRHQLRKHRWNCSSLGGKNKNPHSSPIMSKGFRETSFVNALLSAGITHSVARGCSSGSLVSCGCGHLGPPAGRRSRSWKWGGCSHNVHFGVHFSRLLLDSREKAKDIQSNVNLHNNNAGRLAIFQNMEVKCKCHGMSGSCEMKTCWRATPNFRKVGDRLKAKFRYANLVDQANAGSGYGLRLAFSSRRKRPLDTDLTYYEKSPTFCDTDIQVDSAGTQGRVCNKTSYDIDNCGSLCCGRGYNTIRRKRTEKCNCRFQWCCHVHCQQCTYEDWITVCK